MAIPCYPQFRRKPWRSAILDETFQRSIFSSGWQSQEHHCSPEAMKVAIELTLHQSARVVLVWRIRDFFSNVWREMGEKKTQETLDPMKKTERHQAPTCGKEIPKQPEKRKVFWNDLVNLSSILQVLDTKNHNHNTKIHQNSAQSSAPFSFTETKMLWGTGNRCPDPRSSRSAARCYWAPWRDAPAAPQRSRGRRQWCPQPRPSRHTSDRTSAKGDHKCR